MSKRIFRNLAGLPATILLLALTAVSCKEKKESSTQTSPITVTTEEVRTINCSEELTVSGNIEGLKTVKTGFQVAGRIAGIVGEEGCMVRKDQEIAWLDPTNYAIGKELADIQVDQVTDEFNRLNILHERSSVSESDFMKCKYALEGAKAQQKLRAKDLADTKLYAPISGILLKKMGEAGEMISAGMPVLVISDISRVKVNAYISENQLKNVRIGQEVDILINAIDARRKGVITEVGGMAEPTTRAFTIKAVVDNPDMSIRPGMIAEIKIAIPDSTEATLVSHTAILNTPFGQPYVYIVDKERNKAFKRNVSLGAVHGEEIEITSGVTSGEKVVTGGAHKLSNGCNINIKE